MSNRPTKKIEDIEKGVNLCDHSVEEWKQGALEYLEDIEANFDLHSMNNGGISLLQGEHGMLKAMINFIKNN